MPKPLKLTKADVARALDMRAVGHTLDDIAAGIGATRAALARFADREGVDLSADVRPNVATIRRYASTLPTDAERAAFLMEALEWLCPEHDRRSYLPLCGAFTEMQARFLTVLHSARGRTVTRDHVAQSLYMTSADHVGDKTVSVMVCHVRKRIKALGWPLDLQTVWGVGFRLRITDPRWRWPT